MRIELRSAKLAQQALERGTFRIYEGPIWKVLAVEGNAIIVERS